MAKRTLPTVKHRTPCRECPFRRASAAGWLGGGSATDWYSDIRFGDTAFNCHMAAKKEKNHYCAGSMIHYANQLKTPRDPQFAADAEQFKPDKVNVFQWAHEFYEHHADGLLSETRKPRR
jgi:hypothetical protein